jgi:hypothetical protein
MGNDWQLGRIVFQRKIRWSKIMVRNTTVGSLPLGLSRRFLAQCSATLVASLLLICGWAIFCGLPVQAQGAAGGGIQGTITDPNGAAVAKAQVTATNTETGVAVTHTTDNKGLYSISPLAVGTYNVEVTAKGFQRLLQENIEVDNSSMYGLNLKLTVGGENTTITVTDAPPPMDTTDATLGGTIENELYSELPLSMNNGSRDATAFQYLMPGVQENPDNNTAQSSTAGASGIYGGTGQTGLNENYVEGVPVSNISAQGNGAAVANSVSVDAVDQFSVQTNGASTSFGGAGVTNYTIKSGGNQFHGAVFDYLRNTMFDTWGYFSKVAQSNTGIAVKPGEHQNNYGGSLGGPILKDKLFFFGSAEGFHLTRLSNTPQTITIPTLLNRQGNFTDALGSAVENIANPITGSFGNRAPFQGLYNGVPTLNVIENQYLSSISTYLQSALPAPNNLSTFNNYLAALPLEQATYDLTVRLDYTLNSRNKLSLVGTGGNRGYGNDPDYTGGYSQLPVPYAKGIFTNTKTASGIFSYTYIASQSLINSLKYGYTRNWGEGFSVTENQTSSLMPASNCTDPTILGNENTCAAGITNLPPGNAEQSMPNVSFSQSNGPQTPVNWSSVANTGPGAQNAFSLIDNLQWIKQYHGLHNITFGVQVQWLESNVSGYGGFSNTISLAYNAYSTEVSTTSNGTNGDAYASYLVGAVYSGSVANQSIQDTGGRFRPMSPYIQDNWQVSPKLTLNLGFRYDYLQPYHEVKDRISFLNSAVTNPITGNLGVVEYAGFPNPANFPAQAANPQTNTPAMTADQVFAMYEPYICHCTTPVHPFNKNFEPRIGFVYAYTPTTVISGQFGVQLTHAGGTGGGTGASSGTGNGGEYGLTTGYAGPSGSTGNPGFFLNPSLTGSAIALLNTSSNPPQGSNNGVTLACVTAGTCSPYSALPPWGTAGVSANPLLSTGNYSFVNYFNYDVGTCLINGVGCGASLFTDSQNHYNCSVSSTAGTCNPGSVTFADPYYGGRGPQYVNWNFGLQKMINKKANLSINYAGSETHFLPGGAGRGLAQNSFSPDYDSVLQGTQSSLYSSALGTYVQSLFPSFQLPYAGFTGGSATVGAALKPYPQFGSFNDLWGNTGNSNYNSLQVMVIQRPWHNLSGFVNYTRSKQIDDNSTHRTQWGVGPQDGNFTKQIPANHVDRGLGKYSQANAINVTWVYKFPFGRGQAFFSTNRIAGLIAGGWELSGIYKYRDGYPLQVTNGKGCETASYGGQGTCMPDYAVGFDKRQARINGRWGRGPGANASNYNKIQYLNSAAFVCPDSSSQNPTNTCGSLSAGGEPETTWKLGNVARSAPDGLTGPGWWDVDMGLRRTFNVRETATLHLTFQLEADVQNVTNSTFYNLSSASWNPPGGVSTQNSATSYGEVSGQNASVPPRDWQFAGRFRF